MDNKQLMLEIHKTSKCWKKYMGKIAQQSGIPDSYRMILMFISRHPGTNQKELSKFCQRTPASISQTIKEMILTGFLEKKYDTSDQRYVKLFLSDKGTQSSELIEEKVQKADKMISSILPEDKETEMIEMLHLLSDRIKKELLD